MQDAIQVLARLVERGGTDQNSTDTKEHFEFVEQETGTTSIHSNSTSTGLINTMAWGSGDDGDLKGLQL